MAATNTWKRSPSTRMDFGWLHWARETDRGCFFGSQIRLAHRENWMPRILTCSWVLLQTASRSLPDGPAPHTRWKVSRSSRLQPARLNFVWENGVPVKVKRVL